jgi:hypothetical protein
MTTFPRFTREPHFHLGEEPGHQEIAGAVRAAVRTGRVICKIAPKEYWVDIADRKQDEWADYSKTRGVIIWSLDRINDIITNSETDIRDSFDRIWEIRSYESLPWALGAELGKEIIEAAALRQGINIHGHFQHFADSSTTVDYTVAWRHITCDGRYGIGN